MSRSFTADGVRVLGRKEGPMGICSGQGEDGTKGDPLLINIYFYLKKLKNISSVWSGFAVHVSLKRQNPFSTLHCLIYIKSNDFEVQKTSDLYGGASALATGSIMLMYSHTVHCLSPGLYLIIPQETRLCNLPLTLTHFVKLLNWSIEKFLKDIIFTIDLCSWYL